MACRGLIKKSQKVLINFFSKTSDNFFHFFFEKQFNFFFGEGYFEDLRKAVGTISVRPNTSKLVKLETRVFSLIKTLLHTFLLYYQLSNNIKCKGNNKEHSDGFILAALLYVC